MHFTFKHCTGIFDHVARAPKLVILRLFGLKMANFGAIVTWYDMPRWHFKFECTHLLAPKSPAEFKPFHEKIVKESLFQEIKSVFLLSLISNIENLQLFFIAGGNRPFFDWDFQKSHWRSDY